MKYWVYILIGIIVLVAIILVLLYLKPRKSKNISNVTIDDVFMENLIHYLGNINNIKECNVVGGRIQFTVNDLKNVLLEELKNIGGKGIFLSGNKIKMNFNYDSLEIHNLLSERINR